MASVRVPDDDDGPMETVPDDAPVTQLKPKPNGANLYGLQVDPVERYPELVDELRDKYDVKGWDYKSLFDVSRGLYLDVPDALSNFLALVEELGNKYGMQEADTSALRNVGMHLSEMEPNEDAWDSDEPPEDAVQIEWEHALRNHDIGSVRRLLDEQSDRIDVNAPFTNRLDGQNEQLLLPVVLLSGLGHLDVVQSLIDHDADLDLPDGNGVTAIVAAASDNRRDVTDLLVREDANLDHALDDGTTALMIASKCEYEGVVAELVGDDAPEDWPRADVNLADRNGDTALIHAARRGYGGVVDLLLRHGANARATNHNGETAWWVAAEKGHDEVAADLAQAATDAGHA